MQSQQENLNWALDVERDRFKEERKSLTNKVDDLNQTIKQLERENTTLESNKESMNDSIQRWEADLVKVTDSLTQEKKTLDEKLEALQKENTETSNDFIAKKLEFGRVEALLKQ